MEIAAALLTLSTAAFGWSVYLAYQAGRILERVSHQVADHEKRLQTLERRRRGDELAALH